MSTIGDKIYLIQPFWKLVWEFLKKIHLGLYTKKMKSVFQKDICIFMFIHNCNIDGMKENADKQMNKENVNFTFHELFKYMQLNVII